MTRAALGFSLRTDLQGCNSKWIGAGASSVGNGSLELIPA